MSPKVTITISAADWAAELRAPEHKARAAVEAALAKGLRLRTGEAGVAAGIGEWRVDRHLLPPGVSIVGAILLQHQPDPIEGEDPLVAAARALGVELAWMEGLADGWDRHPMHRRHQGREREHYARGYWTAMQFPQARE